jgi:uncharacterized membrane protein
MSGAAATLDRTVARILRWGIGASIALLAIGVALMVVHGVDPLGPPPPPFSLAAIPSDLVSLQPTAFLWLGLILAIATPSIRVVASLVGFARTGQRRMVIISVAILVVIAVSVLTASLAL